MSSQNKKEIRIPVIVESNIDELMEKAQRFNELMEEAKTVAAELASFELEFKV